MNESVLLHKQTVLSSGRINIKSDTNKSPIDQVHSVVYGDDGYLRFSVLTQNGDQMTLKASTAAAKTIADMIYLELSKQKSRG